MCKGPPSCLVTLQAAGYALWPCDPWRAAHQGVALEWRLRSRLCQGACGIKRTEEPADVLECLLDLAGVPMCVVL
jgi:hypothetical protein